MKCSSWGKHHARATCEHTRQFTGDAHLGRYDDTLHIGLGCNAGRRQDQAYVQVLYEILFGEGRYGGDAQTSAAPVNPKYKIDIHSISQGVLRGVSGTLRRNPAARMSGPM